MRASKPAGEIRHPTFSNKARRGSSSLHRPDIDLEVWLSTRCMRDEGVPPFRASVSNSRSLYWTLAQLITHHASNGCNLRSGDLIATGTVSGPEPYARSCLLERTSRGTEPLTLPTGEVRKFLEAGDEVMLRASASRAGNVRIGFGECRGIVLEPS
jgi:fumarylacetoacetase